MRNKAISIKSNNWTKTKNGLFNDICEYNYIKYQFSSPKIEQ